MKKQSGIFLFAFVSIFYFSGYGQEECKVLVPELVGTYEGKCKKGLANGKGKAVGKDTYEGQFTKGLPDGSGTYYWANGDVYQGDWLNGMREGVGILTFQYQEKDSVLAGLWKKDEYKGPVPAKPKVNYMTGVDRYTFLKYGDIQNKVLISILQNGSANTTIEGLRTSTSSGVNTQSGTSFGFDYITFPVTIKVNYTTYNKLHTNKYYVVFEFTISEPGEWQVNIYN
ncbi:MAG TPA: hypothetical protein VIN10_02915 [Bacteroidales bacterium]